jgi:hypothetical protein
MLRREEPQRDTFEERRECDPSRIVKKKGQGYTQRLLKIGNRVGQEVEGSTPSLYVEPRPDTCAVRPIGRSGVGFACLTP